MKSQNKISKYLSIQFSQSGQCIISILEMHKSVIFNFFNSFDFAELFKRTPQLIVGHVRLQIANIKNLDLRRTRTFQADERFYLEN